MTAALILSGFSATADAMPAPNEWVTKAWADPIDGWHVVDGVMTADQKFMIYFGCYGVGRPALAVTLIDKEAMRMTFEETLEYRIGDDQPGSIQMISGGTNVLHIEDHDQSVAFGKAVAQGSMMAIRVNGVLDTINLTNAKVRLESFIGYCDQSNPSLFEQKAQANL